MDLFSLVYNGQTFYFISNLSDDDIKSINNTIKNRGVIQVDCNETSPFDMFCEPLEYILLPVEIKYVFRM